MSSTQFDSIVIGAGSAGSAFANQAAKLGAKVLVVERAELGGTCVNRGCVPKKILWAAAGVVRTGRQGASEGLWDPVAVQYEALIDRRDAHIASIHSSFAENFDASGATLIRGTADIVDAGTVRIDGTAYHAKNIVLACGSRPTAMDIDGSEHLETSDDVLNWRSLPEKLVIVGGGYIGCEFAAIFNAFGVEVTLVHEGDHVLDTFDPALARHVQDGLVASGISIKLNDEVTAVSRQADRLHYRLGSGGVGTADHVVAAVGRTPNVDCLGPIADRLEIADTGALSVDDRLQTNVPGIHAVGDIADRLPLTPVATTDGTALAHILHGHGAPLCDLDFVATTTFVYPPAAFVGTIDGDHAREGTSTPLEDNVLTPDGDHVPNLYRIGIDPDSQTLTGAQIVGKHADDMIALAAALVAARAPASALTRATAIHPSFAEEFFHET